MNILLIEDNPGDIMLAQEALKEAYLYSYELDIVKDGESALAFINQVVPFDKKKRPDLIIMDLNIPRKNGTEVLHYIKSHPDLKDIYVVVFSTSEAVKDIDTSYKLGANCYLSKPVDYEEYVWVISSMVKYWGRFIRQSHSAVIDSQ